jgi:hypothetical protein
MCYHVRDAQGLVLGLKHFTAYFEHIVDIFARRGLLHHQYADDVQTIGHGLVGSTRNIALTLHDCITDGHQWCPTKRLQLSAEKTEVVRFGKITHLNRTCAEDKCIMVGQAVIELSNVVRDFGVIFDASCQCATMLHERRRHVFTIYDVCTQ